MIHVTHRSLAVALFAALLSFNALAEEQRLNCLGKQYGEQLGSGEKTATTDATFLLRILRENDKVYLALASEAHIEASLVDGRYRLDDIPDTLGTRSLNYNPESRELAYQAVVTRHGEPVSAYHFDGVCTPSD